MVMSTRALTVLSEIAIANQETIGKQNVMIRGSKSRDWKGCRRTDFVDISKDPSQFMEIPIPSKKKHDSVPDGGLVAGQ
jgi:hypothetical protein